MAAAWPYARGFLSLLVPLFEGEPQPFGPRPLQEIALNLFATTLLCCAAGYLLTRTTVLLRLVSWLHKLELRDEAWEELKLDAAQNFDAAKSGAAMEDGATKAARRRPPGKRTATELLFIAVHNGTVTLLAALAWLIGSPALALNAFCLEVAYEIFDTFSLGLGRLEPETLIHHIVSPICILCSTQTTVDYRVLCHLCFCIDLSGAVLGYSKFLLHYAHVSASQVYRVLTWLYFAFRVLGPLIDTAIIVYEEVTSKGGLFAWGSMLDSERGHAGFAKTDWTQLYFWAIAVLNAFNLYFFFVIRARAKMPAHLVASLERATACQ